MRETVTLRTDTAEIALFDPSMLKHRLGEVPDWWTIPSKALEDINSGNALFLDVGSDGAYVVHIHDEAPEAEVATRANLCIPTGTLFIGPGEMISADGHDPDPTFGGKFVQVPPGDYVVKVGLRTQRELDVALTPGASESKNSFREPPSLTHNSVDDR